MSFASKGFRVEVFASGSLRLHSGFRCRSSVVGDAGIELRRASLKSFLG